MKAKEYAEQYQKDIDAGVSIEQAGWNVLRSMYAESVDLAKERSHGDTPSNECVVGVLNEQALKWRAFVRRSGAPLQNTAFFTIIRHFMKESWAELVQAGFRG